MLLVYLLHFGEQLAVDNVLEQSFDKKLDVTLFSSLLVFLLRFHFQLHAVLEDVIDQFSQLPGRGHLCFFRKNAAGQMSCRPPDIRCGALCRHGGHFEGIAQKVVDSLG